MMTTLTKFAGVQRGNYCTLPSKDVEIVSPEPICGARHLVDGNLVPCYKPIVDTGRKQYGISPIYAHTDGTNEGQYVAPATRCRYCGTNDPELVHYRQHAYYDAVECDRCGGVNGHPIGD